MFPSKEEVLKLASAGKYRRIPVAKEILSDRFTPVEVMRTLRAQSNHCFMLESAEQDQRWGRWTFLAGDPLLEITRQQVLYISTHWRSSPANCLYTILPLSKSSESTLFVS